MERRQSVFDTTKSKLSESRVAGTRTRWKYKSSHLLKIKEGFISLPDQVPDYIRSVAKENKDCSMQDLK